MSSDAVVIASAARTPMGGFQGALKDVPATATSAQRRFALPWSGRVSHLPTSRKSSWATSCPRDKDRRRRVRPRSGPACPLATGCTTINKMCGSG